MPAQATELSERAWPNQGVTRERGRILITRGSLCFAAAPASELGHFAGEGTLVGYQHFALAVSLPLTAEQLAAILMRLVRGGRRVDFRGAPSESDADIVADVVALDDPIMPRLFECWSDAGLEELGLYPDLRFAIELWREYGADSHCDFYPFADDGLDPRDPHRFLACVSGQWWLATVVFPPGARAPGGESVRLIRPIEVPSGTAAA